MRWCCCSNRSFCPNSRRRQARTRTLWRGVFCDLLSREERANARTLSEMAGLRATIPIWIPAFAGKAGDYFLNAIILRCLLLCKQEFKTNHSGKTNELRQPIPQNADDPKVMATCSPRFAVSAAAFFPMRGRFMSRSFLILPAKFLVASLMFRRE